jgi:hypothetical protein
LSIPRPLAAGSFIVFAVIAEAKMRESIKKKTHDKLDKLKKDKKKSI